MPQYDVYAMGHAVVDYNYDAPINNLTLLGVQPGVMNLISPRQTKELLVYLGKHQGAKELGGSAANTMTALAHLGGRGFHSCKVANDLNGKAYAKGLTKIGLATNLNLQPLATGTTGECIIFATPDGYHTMAGHLGISQQYSTNEIIENALINSTFLFVEGYLMHPQNSQKAVIKAIELAKKNHVKVALSFSDLSIVKAYKQPLVQLLKNSVDILFCNKDEALEFCNTANPHIANSTLTDYAKKYIITLGKDGALLYDGKNYHHIPAYNTTTIVNTVGAGDTFAGAFLFGLTQGKNFVESGKLASLAASKVIAKRAPRINKKDASTIIAAWLSLHSPA